MISGDGGSHAAADPQRSVPFVPYLEGMRGCAALYVVCFHTRIWLEARGKFGPSSHLLPFDGRFLLYGHYAVGIFIVLSGFVLTLPVATRGSLPGGIIGFIKRRARRLFPAYYAALTFGVPLWLWALALNGIHTAWVQTAYQYLFHALFLEDFSRHYIYTVNGAMWTLAVEVQIYAVFALVLLAVYRRWGLAAFLAVAFGLGCAPTILAATRHEHPYPLETACFWYLALFALGGAAAFIAYDRDDRYARIRTRVPWKLVSLATLAVFLWQVAPRYDASPFYQSSFFALDLVLGLATAAGFLAVAADRSAGKRSIVAGIFSTPPLVRLGSFSYSLYLIHFPIVLVAMHYLQKLAPAPRLLLSFIVLIPLLVVLSYAFAVIFEFPFVSAARRRADEIALSNPKGGRYAFPTAA